MTDIASLELCKELYEISGWQIIAISPGAEDKYLPRYTLGYLLRKICKNDDRMRILRLVNQFMQFMRDGLSFEDAACKLAIELFKQGVLNA